MSKAKPVESAAEFWDVVAKSGIFSADKLSELRQQTAALNAPQEIARQLLRLGLLTKWQAGQLLVGASVLSLGGYRLCDVLSKQDLAREFLAEDDAHGRTLGLWLFSPRFSRSKDFVGQLAARLPTLLQLKHPQIVSCSGGRAEVDRCYLVHQLQNRRSLRHVVTERGPLNETQVVEYVRQAAWGLEALQQCGLVHGDIRPDNLYVDEEGQLAVRDVAGHLARVSAPPPAEAGEDDLAAWADYITPEELHGQTTDHRADLYGLGCSAYFLLTGKPPFAGTLEQRREAHRQDEFPRLETLSGVSAGLTRLVARLVAKDPAARWDSVAEFLHSLHNLDAPTTIPAGAAADPAPPAESPAGAIEPSASVDLAPAGDDLPADRAAGAGSSPESDSTDDEGGFSFVVVRKPRKTTEAMESEAERTPAPARAVAKAIPVTQAKVAAVTEGPVALPGRPSVESEPSPESPIDLAESYEASASTAGTSGDPLLGLASVAPDEVVEPVGGFPVLKRRREGEKRAGSGRKLATQAAASPKAEPLEGAAKKRFSPQVLLAAGVGGGFLLIIVVILGVVFFGRGQKGPPVVQGTPVPASAGQAATPTESRANQAPDAAGATPSATGAPGATGAPVAATVPAAGGSSSTPGAATGLAGLGGALTSAPASPSPAGTSGSPVSPPATTSGGLASGGLATGAAAPRAAPGPDGAAQTAASATPAPSDAKAGAPKPDPEPPSPLEIPAADAPSPPPAATPPAPEPPAKPFRDLPQVVSLPPVDAGEDGLTTLGMVQLKEGDLCFIRLKGADRALKGKFQWGMANAQGGTAEKDWEITLGDEANPVTVALLSAREQKLTFRWTAEAAEAARAPFAQSLRNCVLALSCGPEKHDMALRVPEKVEPWSVNLEKEQNREKWTVEHGPPPDSVRIEFTGVSGIPKISTDPAGPAEVVKGGQWIWFAEREADAVLGLRVEANFAGRTLNLNGTPYFKLGPEPLKMNAANIRAVKLQLSQIPQAKLALERMKQANKENPLLPNEEQRLKAMENAEVQVKKLEEQYTALKSGCQIQFHLVHDAEDQKVSILTTGP